MALLVNHNYKTAVTTRPVSLWPSEVSPTKKMAPGNICPAPCTVRAAIDSHNKQASDSSSEAHVYHVTRIVKTAKPNSVMGQGLFVSEERVQPKCCQVSPTSESDNSIRYSPSFPPLFNSDDMRKETAASGLGAIDINAGAREVRLDEPTLESVRRSHKLNPIFHGVGAEDVPPELVARSVDLDTWRSFANALNAAVLCSAQEIGTQVKRWNADVFARLGFQVGLRSIDSSGICLCIK